MGNKKYSQYIEYIPGEKNIEADDLLQLTKNVNQETTHYSTYTAETMSK